VSLVRWREQGVRSVFEAHHCVDAVGVTGRGQLPYTLYILRKDRLEWSPVLGDKRSKLQTVKKLRVGEVRSAGSALDSHVKSLGSQLKT
jgi:hypothetical protein